MKTKSTLFAFSLCATIVGATAGVAPAQDELRPAPPTNKEAVQAKSLVEILLAKPNPDPPLGDAKNNSIVVGPAGLAFKKALIVTEGENNFTAHLTIDDFNTKLGNSLVVRVGDKVLKPASWGGNDKRYWLLELRDLDRDHTEILNGGPIPDAPKENFRVEYAPYQPIYKVDGPINIGFHLSNVGKTPTTVFWGTLGSGNDPRRDTQLAFTATLDGAPVPANPKPLLLGYLCSPYVSKPDNTLKRTAELSEWLQFSKPGEYLIKATYTLEIVNPQEDASPARWKVTYRDQFSVRVEK